MKDIHQLIELVDHLVSLNNGDINEIDLLISELKEKLTNEPINAKTIGPLIARLSKLKKSKTVQSKYLVVKNHKYSDVDKKSNWIEVSNGFLMIGHKPGGKNRSFQSLFNENTDVVLTILSKREGAISIGENCKLLGIDWIWLPLSNGNIPSKKINSELKNVFEIIREKLKNEKRIFIHCSAGLHRTGMITNALLLFLGYDEKISHEILYKLRPITAKEVRNHRLNWGKDFINNLKIEMNGLIIVNN